MTVRAGEPNLVLKDHTGKQWDVKQVRKSDGKLELACGNEVKSPRPGRTDALMVKCGSEVTDAQVREFAGIKLKPLPVESDPVAPAWESWLQLCFLLTGYCLMTADGSFRTMFTICFSFDSTAPARAAVSAQLTCAHYLSYFCPLCVT